jgi:hypothetical protein
MPATNPSGQAPAQGAGLEDPRNWLGPPAFPSAVDSNLVHPSANVVAATMERFRATSAQAALTSGTVYLVAIGIKAGTVCTACTMFTNSTAKTGGTHGWYVLTDRTYTVIAATADQTDAATVWGAASTGYTLPFSAPAIALYTGVYYVGIMVAQSGGGTPTISGAGAPAAGINAGTGITNPIILCGSSTSGLTTPPAVGTALSAASGGTNSNFYAYLT